MSNEEAEYLSRNSSGSLPPNLPTTRCPSCGSRSPLEHPAVSGGGEVTRLCEDSYHSTPIVDWGTSVGRPSVDDDVAALADASDTPEALLKGSPEADEPGQPQGEDDDLPITSDAQMLRVLMVERAAKVLIDLAERPAIGRRSAVVLDDVLELADYYINGDDDEEVLPSRGVSPSFTFVDEGKRFFDQMAQQANFRPGEEATERQARIYRDGSPFHTMTTGKSHPRFTTGGTEKTFGELLDALMGMPVQANILVEELQVGDLVTSHGDKVVWGPVWNGVDGWEISVHCPKKGEDYTRRAKVDDRVNIYNQR